MLSAGDHDVRIAGADRLRGERDRLQARAAQHVDRRRRHRLRDAGRERGLPRRVLAQAGLQHAAQQDLVDRVGGQAHAIERATHGARGELRGGDVFQRAAEHADWRAQGADDDGLIHPAHVRRGPERSPLSGCAHRGRSSGQSGDSGVSGDGHGWASVHFRWRAIAVRVER
jgi:hypothetical protein